MATMAAAQPTVAETSIVAAVGTRQPTRRLVVPMAEVVGIEEAAGAAATRMVADPVAAVIRLPGVTLEDPETLPAVTATAANRM